MGLSSVAKVSLLVVWGLFLGVLGLAAYVLFPMLFRWQIEENLVLSPGAQIYSYWKDSATPSVIRFYFFNITNTMEIWGRLSKPILEEIGPYTFRVVREKSNITWHENGTVSYRLVRRWYFQSDLTNGSLDDVIATINVPMVTCAFQARLRNDDAVKDTVSQLINSTNSSLFVWKPIRQLLFEGYSDAFIRKASTFNFDLEYDRFGWFYGKNNSDNEIYAIFTGEFGMDLYGFVDLWNGDPELKYWDPPCNLINGSAGDLWPPFVDSHQEKLTMFVPDICRPVSLSYLVRKDVKGLKTLRYWADHTVFDNGKYDSENACYCSEECLAPGALNASTCLHGAPVLVSYPHFLFADSIYSQGVIGLRPLPRSHEFFVDIEPIMGIPVNVAIRMQINVIVERIDGINQFANFTGRTIYPIFWYSETATVDNSTAKTLRFLTRELSYMVTIGAFVVVAVGGILLLFALGIAIQHSRQKAKTRRYTAVKQTATE